MRASLIRQGEGPAAAYERQRREREAERAKVERITRDSADLPDVVEKRAPRRELTKPGDERKLRGIPVQARGVGGTMPGSDPLAEVLRSDRG